jgi:hypothetical protein
MIDKEASPGWRHSLDRVRSTIRCIGGRAGTQFLPVTISGCVPLAICARHRAPVAVRLAVIPSFPGPSRCPPPAAGRPAWIGRPVCLSADRGSNVECPCQASLYETSKWRIRDAKDRSPYTRCGLPALSQHLTHASIRVRVAEDHAEVPALQSRAQKSDALAKVLQRVPEIRDVVAGRDELTSEAERDSAVWTLGGRRER